MRPKAGLAVMYVLMFAWAGLAGWAGTHYFKEKVPPAPQYRCQGEKAFLSCLNHQIAASAGTADVHYCNGPIWLRGKRVWLCTAKAGYSCFDVIAIRLSDGVPAIRSITERECDT